MAKLGSNLVVCAISSRRTEIRLRPGFWVERAYYMAIGFMLPLPFGVVMASQVPLSTNFQALPW